MSNYAYELEESTSFINENDFSSLLEKIKGKVGEKEWKNFGWTQSVLSAETLEDALKKFGIEVEYEEDGFYRPVIDDVYVSTFFRELIQLAAPYMTDGEMLIKDDFSIITIKFHDHTVWKRRGDYTESLSILEPWREDNQKKVEEYLSEHNWSKEDVLKLENWASNNNIRVIAFENGLTYGLDDMEEVYCATRRMIGLSAPFYLHNDFI